MSRRTLVHSVSPHHLRKWGIVDEPTWHKSVPVPITVGSGTIGTDPGRHWTRDAGNPSIENTDVTWAVANYHPRYPNVCYFEGYWYKFFNMHRTVALGGGVRGRYSNGFGVFRGDSLKGPWTEWNNGAAILTNGAATTDYDYDAMSNPCVVVDYDAAGTGEDHRWKMMYYSRNDDPAIAHSYSFAYSAFDPPATPGGVWTWAKCATNPRIPSDEVNWKWRASGSLIKMGRKFIYAVKSNQESAIRTLYSHDFITWVDHGINFLTAPAGYESVSYPQIYFDSGVLYVPFGAYDAGLGQYDICMAYNYDVSFLTACKLEHSNPILSPDASAHENDHYIYPGTLVREGLEYCQFYTAHNAANVASLCLATLDLSAVPM